MKRLFFALALAVFAATGIGATTMPSAAQATMGGMQNVTGDWAVQITGDQLLVGTLHLTQVGNTVVGSAEAGGNSGVLQIDGTLSGQTLSAKFRGPKGNTGWLTLNFNAKGTAFSGEWGYNGRKPNGKIVSRKFISTAF